jgi:ribonuclease HI
MTDSSSTTQQLQLTIHTDGGSRGNPGPAAAGVFVLNGEEVVAEEKHYLGIKTNNDAEYTAFVDSLIWLKTFITDHKVEKVIWKLDSQLVVEQLNRRWKIKEPRIQQFAQHIWQELATLKIPFHIMYVPRAQNKEADRLVNQALDEQQIYTS